MAKKAVSYLNSTQQRDIYIYVYISISSSHFLSFLTQTLTRSNRLTSFLSPSLSLYLSSSRPLTSIYVTSCLFYSLSLFFPSLVASPQGRHVEKLTTCQNRTTSRKAKKSRQGERGQMLNGKRRCFDQTEQRCEHPTFRFVGCRLRTLKDMKLPEQSDSRDRLC